MRSEHLFLALVCAACGTPSPAATPRASAMPYRVCDEARPCARDQECVEGLCLARCGAGGACREENVCWAGECRETCDAQHSCNEGYRCGDDAECHYDPCGSITLWPYSIRSSSLPLLAHYRDPAEEPEARVALAAAEEGWRIQTTRFGFDAPLSDEGRCGPDGALDVFVWRTFRACVSDVACEVERTPHDDRANYLIVDPYGPYGGEHLRATVAHELHHAMQAVHDWNETPIAFEMSAQLIESLIAPEEATWPTYFTEYQQHADWSFDHDDHYTTWYMYGSALYLHFLRDRVFTGAMQDRFLSEVWRGCRNPPGDNEPDLIDALDAVLRAHASIDFEESLARFARARWYTGTRDDGAHFRAGARMPAEAMVPVRELAAPPEELREGPMLLGTHYVRVRDARARGAAGSSQSELRIRFDGDPRVRWRIEARPGLAAGTDGDTISLDARGELRVPTAEGERTLAILALPRDPADWDPDRRTDARFSYRLEALSPAGAP
ncbi:MAG: hypothetical protein IT378_01735 [Sandaracinaceae bacterium]|nr:hypothetical protein [Sandaracinaceae bacterium]